jgi:alkylhydroperoxidase/carboxymuconolactone decarboxylase family protein YurZ
MPPEAAGTADELIEEMRARRGYLYPELELAIRLDPEFMRAYDDLVGRVFLYDGVDASGAALSPKYREIIAAALLAGRGRRDHVLVHARNAMRHGASERELLEAFEVALGPSGLPAFLTGLEALHALVLEREEEARAGDE